jgi:DNA-binding MarR family transcriptional regulator
MDENSITADRLHSAAIHLLRRLRLEDAASGLTAPWLSALSVIVFAGPLTMTKLAEAEQVRPPTITRLVRDLEGEGLVQRAADPADKRIQRVWATAKGRALLQAGRARRVEKLAAQIAGLMAVEREVLARAVPILEQITLPREHPHRPASERGE